jgi:myo-inositol 2-dehydrogenase / D-chiro-inositol 1-dehydrogenase
MAGRHSVCLDMNTTTPASAATRRTFLKTAALASATLAAPAILPGTLFAADKAETLRVGLIGCGGRGRGAAANALRADPKVVLTALGDVFPEPLEYSLKTLRTTEDIAAQVKVPPENCFVGFDAYQKVLASGVDVVLLAAPPGFRPRHLHAAVAAGKHIFAEKPMAVDATGVRSILASAKEAKQKNLSLVAGFCYRYNVGVRAFMEQIHNGAVGDIRAIHTTYNTGGVWNKPRQPGWTDLEWQLRNWMYFTWLSGDHITEQAVHNLDKMAWLMKDVPPLSCMAIGGRQVRTEEQFGHIYDHFGVVYDYPDDVRAFHFCRQQAGTATDNSDHVWGADGVGHIVRAFSGPFVIRGKTNWRHREERMRDMYQNEHDELFASIRSGKPINDGEWMAHSTLLAIMGRMAAYTGQVVTWEEALNSKEDLFPKQLSWDLPLAVPPVALPGLTKLV